jgi:hypothetical protein
MPDEMDLTREIGDVPEADSAALARAREQFLARLDTHPTYAGRVRPPRPHRRRRPALIAAALAGVAAVTTTAVLLVGGSTPPPPISPAAAATLRRTAAVAAVASELPAGEYLYTKSTTMQRQVVQDRGSSIVGGYNTTSTEEVWVDTGGAGRVETTPISVTALAGSAQANQPLPALPAPQSAAFGATSAEALPFVVNPSGWPTDPAALLAAIEDRLDGGEKTGTAPFLSVLYLLSEVDDPGLRAAGYQALALIPGLTNVGAATDALGRDGQAVAVTAEGITTQAVIDPQTAALLEVTTTLVDPSRAGGPYRDLPAGTVIASKVIDAQSVVDSQTARPW